jgi:hypothetical protein
MKLVNLFAALLLAALSAPALAVDTTIGVAKTSAEIDNTEFDDGLKAFVNVSFDNGMGIEVTTGKYGSLSEDDVDVEIRATNVALLASTRGEVVQFFGKLGISAWEIVVDDYDDYSTDRDSDEDMFIGFGMNIIAGSVTLKAEVEQIDNDNAENRVVSTNIGVGIRF